MMIWLEIPVRLIGAGFAVPFIDILITG